MALVSAAALGGLACGTPAAAIGGDATKEQERAQLQPEQAPEAEPYGVPEGKVYYAQAPSGRRCRSPIGRLCPGASAIGGRHRTAPPGAFFQTIGAMIADPFEALMTPYLEVLARLRGFACGQGDFAGVGVG